MENKSILVIDTPTNCYECPLIYWGNIGGWNCKPTRALLDDANKKPEWCPLRHPLKEVSSDFYIYDRKYLFDNLDREIDLLKGAKAFEEFMKAREE